MILPFPADVTARVRAAVAYGGIEQEAAAAAMGVSIRNFRRFTALSKDRKVPSWEQLWALADACGLQREWFSADLDELYRIVPDGAPRFRRP